MPPRAPPSRAPSGPAKASGGSAAAGTQVRRGRTGQPDHNGSSGGSQAQQTSAMATNTSSGQGRSLSKAPAKKASVLRQDYDGAADGDDDLDYAATELDSDADPDLPPPRPTRPSTGKAMASRSLSRKGTSVPGKSLTASGKSVSDPALSVPTVSSSGSGPPRLRPRPRLSSKAPPPEEDVIEISDGDNAPSPMDIEFPVLSATRRKRKSQTGSGMDIGESDSAKRSRTSLNGTPLTSASNSPAIQSRDLSGTNSPAIPSRELSSEPEQPAESVPKQGAGSRGGGAARQAAEILRLRKEVAALKSERKDLKKEAIRGEKYRIQHLQSISASSIPRPGGQCGLDWTYRNMAGFEDNKDEWLRFLDTVRSTVNKYFKYDKTFRQQDKEDIAAAVRRVRRIHPFAINYTNQWLTTDMLSRRLIQKRKNMKIKEKKIASKTKQVTAADFEFDEDEEAIYEDEDEQFVGQRDFDENADQEEASDADDHDVDEMEIPWSGVF